MNSNMTYNQLRDFAIANQLPDKWFVSLDGDLSKEVFALMSVHKMKQEKPSRIIQILNAQHSDSEFPEWFHFVLHNNQQESSQSTITLAYATAMLIPFVGFLIGLFMISNEKTRPHSTGPIIVSVVFSLVWLYFIMVF